MAVVKITKHYPSLKFVVYTAGRDFIGVFDLGSLGIQMQQVSKANRHYQDSVESHLLPLDKI